MDSVKSLLKFLMQKGCEISVFDEEGVIQHKTIVHEKALEAVNAVDECYIYAYIYGEYKGFASIVNGLDPREKVSDYSDNELFNELFNEWNELFSNQ